MSDSVYQVYHLLQQYVLLLLSSHQIIPLIQRSKLNATCMLTLVQQVLVYWLYTIMNTMQIFAVMVVNLGINIITVNAAVAYDSLQTRDMSDVYQPSHFDPVHEKYLL